MVQVLEYALFGTVIVANLGLGLYFSFRKAPSRRGTASPEAEMFLGSRALRVLPLAASAMASMMSSTGLIAFPAHFYAYGMHMAWGVPMKFVYLPLATRVVVPVIYKLGVTSIFEVSVKHHSISFFYIRYYLIWRENRSLSARFSSFQ